MLKGLQNRVTQLLSWVNNGSTNDNEYGRHQRRIVKKNIKLHGCDKGKLAFVLHNVLTKDVSMNAYKHVICLPRFWMHI